MEKSTSVCITVVLVIFVSGLYNAAAVDAQSTGFNTQNKTAGNATSVSVSATLALQVTNDTLKAKEGLLRSAVINFINSGPTVLKTSPIEQPIVQSKIANNINNDTQNLEGIEATNAIVGVEISKALKTLVSSSKEPNKIGIVTIVTATTCTPSDAKFITCQNIITIK